MRTAKLACCGALLAIALVSTGARAAQHGGSSKAEKEKHAPLNGFYIVTLSVAPHPDEPVAPASATPQSTTAEPSAAHTDSAKTDAAPAWRDTIVDVVQDGTGIVIREISIEPAVGAHCPPHAVIARERDRALPGDSVEQAAGHHHLCSMSESDVAGVIQAANKDDVARENSDDFETQTIVATCGEREHLFELPYPDTLKFHALGLADSHITALWKMSHEVISRAFGDEPFPSAQTAATAGDANDIAAQKLAEKLVPEIRSGRYASGFGDSNCAYASCRDHSAKSALEGYAGVLDLSSCAAPSTTPAQPTPTERGANDR
jgi:hypothetical protein